MACNNTAILTRFFVTIKGGKTPPFPYFNLTKISGLNLGTSGEVTLTEYDKNVTIPDGVLTYDDLIMTFRLGKDIQSEFLKKEMFDWLLNHRTTRTYDFGVSVTDRNFCPLYTFDFIGCSIKKIFDDDKAMDQPGFHSMNVMVKPYEVIPSRFLGAF